MNEIQLECNDSANSDEIQLRWKWDTAVNCYAVVLVHRLPSNIDNESIGDYINKKTDVRIMCYRLEYAKKAFFTYKLKDSDIGMLSFRVYPCSSDGKIKTDICSNTISVVGKIHEINYSIAYDNEGNQYCSCSICIKSPVDLPGDCINYIVGGIQYPISCPLYQGMNQLNNIIIPKKSIVSLCSSEGKGQFRFKKLD